MNPRRRGTAFLLTLATGAVMAACSTSPSAAPTAAQSVAPVQGAGKTLHVWVMQGDYTDATLKAINDRFTQQTGAKVDVQVQSWDGIDTKITTALATTSPPDVLDLGNTQVASFAANGGLKDLTSYATDLKQGQTWLAGLVSPATVDGRLYAVPGFAGARAVIYNKTMWAKAGVTAAPTTYAQLVDDLKKVKSANPADDFSPLYFPGQNWYAGMQFVWDTGGDFATRSGAKWTGAMSSRSAQTGLADFKSFQNKFSAPASRTADPNKPDQIQVFADGKASAIIATSGLIAQIEKDNPELTDADLGTFPFPGKSGKAQPVMLGGSDWGIAARSADSGLALAWTKIAAGPDIEGTWIAARDGLIPNSAEGTKAAADTANRLTKAFLDAALNSRATPASANWAQLEGNLDVAKLFAAVASGSKTPQQAAAAFDNAATKSLNAQQ